MWMAEWLFTDLFERAVTAARGTGHGARANLGPLATVHTDRADRIAKGGQRKQEHEQNPKKKFGGEHFAHEVELQDDENGESPAHTLSNLLILPGAHCQFLELPQNSFHRTSLDFH